MLLYGLAPLVALVKRAEERGMPLSKLPDSAFAEAHAAFEPDVRDVFSWERAVEARGVSGGTARKAIEEQLEMAEQRLEAELPTPPTQGAAL